MSAQRTQGDAAILVMAYGGPDCLDAVSPFMCELTGREPSDDVLGRIKARYAAIGGKSPLPGIANDVATALQRRLSESGIDVPTAIGFRYTPPKIGDVLRDLYGEGVRRVIGISLSPFESSSTSTAYQGAVEACLPALKGMQVTYVPPFGQMAAFAGLHGDGLEEAYGRLDASADEVLTVFTAHSLPLADLETPERYVSGLRTVAALIAARVGLEAGVDFATSMNLPGVTAWGAPDSERPWLLAYQSKGLRPGEWLGPDLADVMETAASHGLKAIAVSPIGFATEHMETRYDLDVVEARRAEELGLGFARAMAPNDAPRLIAETASAVERILVEQG